MCTLSVQTQRFIFCDRCVKLSCAHKLPPFRLYRIFFLSCFFPYFRFFFQIYGWLWPLAAGVRPNENIFRFWHVYFRAIFFFIRFESGFWMQLERMYGYCSFVVWQAKREKWKRLKIHIEWGVRYLKILKKFINNVIIRRVTLSLPKSMHPSKY